MELQTPMTSPWDLPDPKDASYDPDQLIQATMPLWVWECALWAVAYAANVIVATEGPEEKVKVLRQAEGKIEAASDPEAGAGRWIERQTPIRQGEGAAIKARIGEPVPAGKQYTDHVDEIDKDLDSRCTCPMAVREQMRHNIAGAANPGFHHSRGCPLYPDVE